MRRRGEHRRDRAAAGRLRAGRRVHGHRADRAAADASSAGSRSGSGSRSTATPPASRRRCAGWSSPSQQGFDVKVVALPPGVDPADDPTGFDARLAAAEPYLLYRVQDRDRRAPRTARRRSARCKALLDAAPDSPERQDAWRYANDKLGMTVQLRAGGRSARAAAPASQRVLDAEREARAQRARRRCRPPRLRPLLAELTPEHFYDPLHRAIRDHLVDGAPLDAGRRRAARRARRPRRGRGDRRGDRDRAAAPAARARAAARAALGAARPARRAVRGARAPARARSVDRRLKAAATLPPPSIPGSSIGRAFGC